MERYAGVSISKGIAVGSLVRLHEYRNTIRAIYISRSELEAEHRRFELAVQASRRELEESMDLITELLGETQKFIIEPQLMMLSDGFFVNSVAENIRQQHFSLEYAVQKFNQHIRTSFSGVSDDYLRERMQDIMAVTSLILKHAQRLLDEGTEADDGVVHSRGSDLKGAIVYANDITPSELTSLIASGIVGAATSSTSALSHTAILCKSMEIPLVTGVSYGERDECLAVLDGYRGTFIVEPDEPTLADYREKERNHIRFKSLLITSSLHAEMQGLQIAGNVEIPGEALHLKEYSAVGIGLLRSEFMILQMQKLPSFEEQRLFYRSILEKCDYLPATIRTIDIGTDKVADFLNLEVEENPALGNRGIRYSLADRTYFLEHIKAIVSMAELTRVRLLLPMVTLPEEVTTTRVLLDRAIAELRAEGYRVPERIDLGIMVETPACAMTIGAFAKHIDFLSVGTNDLVQYMMASDRTSKGVGYLCSAFHPPVVRILQHIAQSARRYNLPVNICGEVASDIFYLPILHGMGFRSFSVRTPAIPEVRVVLSGIDPARSELLANAVADGCLTASEAIERCVAFLQDVIPAELIDYLVADKKC